uniref:Kazrin, periplakin interacting protein n=1 Tax=Eptatretus burgeri TaxID=7764 RepID=A0A8C4QTQ9_EPTBU
MAGHTKLQRLLEGSKSSPSLLLRPSTTFALGKSAFEGGELDVPGSESKPNKEAFLQKELVRLQDEVEQCEEANRHLLQEMEVLRAGKAAGLPSTSELQVQLTKKEHELARMKEALHAMKEDRRRLREEKSDLVSQMKQLYSTLEEKEQQLRSFIRSYEQHRKENEEATRMLTTQQRSLERDKWEVLRRAQDATERSLSLRAQVDHKEGRIKELEAELAMIQQSLHSLSRDSSKRQSLVTSSDSGESPEWPLPHETVTAAIRKSMQQSHQSSSVDRKGGASGSRSRRSSLVSEETTSSDGMRAVAPSDNNGSPTQLPRSLGNSLEDVNGHLASKEKDKKRLSSFSIVMRGKCRKSSELAHHDASTLHLSPAHQPPLLAYAEPSQVPLETVPSNQAGLGGTPVQYGTPVDAATKMQLVETTRVLPMTQWRSDVVVAWLEVVMSLPMYAKPCRENVKNGKVLLSLSDEELERALGIAQPLHRRKLRLAIEDHREAEKDSSYSLSKASELDHHWVSKTWLRDLGLPQYAHAFQSHLVDGRMLASLMRKDLEKGLGIVSKFHQSSMLHGIELLRSVCFNRELLSKRRQLCESLDVDTFVWTNHRVIRWMKSIDLQQFADNLMNSGVHGALLVLEPSFNADSLATTLRLPQQNSSLRKRLTTELACIMMPTTFSREKVKEREGRGGLLRRGSDSQPFLRNINGRNSERRSLRASLGLTLSQKLDQETGI